MSEVQVFYDELRASAFDLAGAVFVLQTDASNIAGDTGVDAPLGRYSLKSALGRQVDELREATLAHHDASEALRTTLTNIADRYSDLDVELTGEEQP